MSDDRRPMLRSRGHMDLDTASAIEGLSERIDALDASLGREIEDLRVELRHGLDESRRHATILNESTREDIRFVAEAVAGLTVKIDSLLR